MAAQAAGSGVVAATTLAPVPALSPSTGLDLTKSGTGAPIPQPDVSGSVGTSVHPVFASGTGAPIPQPDLRKSGTGAPIPQPDKSGTGAPIPQPDHSSLL